MAKVDGFAEIALRGGDCRDTSLKEVTPVVHDTRYFTKSAESCGPIIEKSYEELLREFYQDLPQLRTQYLPFLKDHAPKVEPRDFMELRKFQFRYEDPADAQEFERVFRGEGDFVSVEVPEYRGPTGKWRGFYRTEFSLPFSPSLEERVWLRFLGADYIANVYVNQRYVGSHEGFFAPFEFDVTPYVSSESTNLLVVEILNDAPMLGIDSDTGRLDGDKIYAATGYGWDDSAEGWHHCPPGAGLCDRVILEKRSAQFISDIFVRPNIDTASVEVWFEVYNSLFENSNLHAVLSVYGKNFTGYTLEGHTVAMEPCGPGVSYFRTEVPINVVKLWQPDSPYLYKVKIDLFQNERLIDQDETHFGMRKFSMDESSEVKGTLFLNNRQVFLRGANTMGHLQQCVLRKDFDQLIDDILIAKYCNMNFYRLTQRPVQSEVYDYCDALGMMLQTDLPTFGWVRRNKFCEAIKQVEEMERHIRRHPSSIMISYINEPFPASWGFRGHRSLLRPELEEFFRAASCVVRIQNPDRVIKQVDGDYDPPTETGLSDFHCYTTWYTNHAIPFGKLHRGYLPALRDGWKAGCGEYGTEGLDPLEIMLEDYPKEWVPKHIDDPWTPQYIVKSQSFTMHGDWYEEQSTIVDWIQSSQQHQAWATKYMNDAFRRASDVLVSTTVHLLIDAWPAGWMKTLVDYRRKPKPAYFAYKDSLKPVRIHLRTDRFMLHGGQSFTVECFSLNDRDEQLETCTITVSLYLGGEFLDSYKLLSSVSASVSQYQGTISCKVPLIENSRDLFHIDVALTHDDTVIDTERLSIPVLPWNGLSDGIENVESYDGSSPFWIFDKEKFSEHYQHIMKSVQAGGVAFISLTDIGNCTIEGKEFSLERLGKLSADGQMGKGVCFIARNPLHPHMAPYDSKDFFCPYDKEFDAVGSFAEHGIQGDIDDHLLFTYDIPSFGIESHGEKRKIGILSELCIGSGRVYLSTLRLKELWGENPQIDQLLYTLMNDD